MKETELAQHVINYFTDEAHEVFKEVPCCGIIDIVVKNGPTIISIECKMQLSFDVIEQAKKNLNYSHYAYIATPPKRRFGSFAHEICKLLGIGVFEVRVLEYPVGMLEIREMVKPRLNRKIVKPRLQDWMKRSVAGSQNDRMTSFKFFVESLHNQLSAYGKRGATPAELFEKTFRHYAKLSYFKRNLMVYTRSGVIKKVEYRDGKFYYVP